MTEQQIHEAIEQMRVHCSLMMATYTMVSARSTLYTLGYDEEQTEAVLLHIADGGFSYCLDHRIACKSGVGEEPQWVYPDADVCYWGPDQLKSRLDSLSNAPRNYGARS